MILCLKEGKRRKCVDVEIDVKGGDENVGYVGGVEKLGRDFLLC